MQKKSLLHIIATGKYEMYFNGVLNSAIENFLPDTELKIVIYTDSQKILNIKDDRIIPIKIDYEPWPYPTLKRFHYFSLGLNEIEKSDYSFYIDVDSFFRKKIDLNFLGLENFPGLIGTLHPGYYGTCGTPERRIQSTACIPFNCLSNYYCGGFFGGNSKNFIDLIKTLRRNIDEDFSRGIIAVWHDESHLNKYFLDNPPVKSMGIGFSSAEENIGRKNFIDPYIAFIDKSEEIKMDKKIRK